jgi:hypothetical protein
MELLIAIPIISALMFYPVLTGLIAKTYGRRFWFWFILGVMLPFVSLVLLHCLPGKIKRINANAQNIQPFFYKNQNNRLKKSA